jgi:TetR/AcrR family transcriptional repressor of nem operon
MARNKQFDPQLTLLKARNLFWTRGFHATSINALVEALAINRASIYDTYGNKRDLFVQCLKSYLQEQTELFDTIMKGEGDFGVRFRNLLLSYGLATSHPDQPAGAFDVHVACELLPSDTEVRDLLDEFHKHQQEVLTQEVAAALDSKSVSFAVNTTPDNIARTLLTYIHGLHVAQKYKPSYEDCDRYANNIIHMVGMTSTGLKNK